MKEQGWLRMEKIDTDYKPRTWNIYTKLFKTPNRDVASLTALRDKKYCYSFLDKMPAHPLPYSHSPTSGSLWLVSRVPMYLTLVNARRSLCWATGSYKALHFLTRPIFGCESAVEEAREVSSNCTCLWTISEAGLKYSPIALACRG